MYTSVHDKHFIVGENMQEDDIHNILGRQNKGNCYNIVKTQCTHLNKGIDIDQNITHKL